MRRVPRAALQQREHCGFFHRQPRPPRALFDARDRYVLSIPVEHAGMDVGAAADRTGGIELWGSQP